MKIITPGIRQLAIPQKLHTSAGYLLPLSAPRLTTPLLTAQKKTAIKNKIPLTKAELLITRLTKMDQGEPHFIIKQSRIPPLAKGLAEPQLSAIHLTQSNHCPRRKSVLEKQLSGSAASKAQRMATQWQPGRFKKKFLTLLIAALLYRPVIALADLTVQSPALTLAFPEVEKLHKPPGQNMVSIIKDGDNFITLSSSQLFILNDNSPGFTTDITNPSTLGIKDSHILVAGADVGWDRHNPTYPRVYSYNKTTFEYEGKYQIPDNPPGTHQNYYEVRIQAFSADGKIAAGYTRDAELFFPNVIHKAFLPTIWRWNDETNNWTDRIFANTRKYDYDKTDGKIYTLSANGEMAGGALNGKGAIWSGTDWGTLTEFPGPVIKVISPDGRYAAGGDKFYTLSFAPDLQYTTETLFVGNREEAGYQHIAVNAITADGNILGGSLMLFPIPHSILWLRDNRGGWKDYILDAQSEIHTLSPDGSLAGGFTCTVPFYSCVIPKATLWRLRYTPLSAATAYRSEQRSEVNALFTSPAGLLTAAGSVTAANKPVLWLADTSDNYLQRPLMPLQNHTFNDYQIRALGLRGNDLITGGYASDSSGNSRAIIWQQQQHVWQTPLTLAQVNAKLFALSVNGLVAGGEQQGKATLWHGTNWSVSTQLTGGNGDSAVTGLALTGDKAAGYITTGENQHAATWQGANWSSFTDLAAGRPGNSRVLTLSGDGNFAGGFASEDEKLLPAIWRLSQSNALVSPQIPSDSLAGQVNSLSLSAKIAGGFYTDAQGTDHPALWYDDHHFSLLDLKTLKTDGSGNARVLAVSQDSALVAGWSDSDSGEHHAAIWKVGYMLTPEEKLSTPSVSRITLKTSGDVVISRGRAINEDNQYTVQVNTLFAALSDQRYLAGSLLNQYATPRASIWQWQNNSYQLTRLPGLTEDPQYASGVNALAWKDNQWIAGGMAEDSDATPHAVIWRGNQAPVDLGGTNYSSSIHALSLIGDVAGGKANNHATLWTGENWATTHQLSDSASSVLALSAYGNTAAGYNINENTEQAALWTNNNNSWQPVSLSIPDPHHPSRILALSADGNIAAGYTLDDDNRSQPLLWQATNTWQAQPLPVLKNLTWRHRSRGRNDQPFSFTGAEVTALSASGKVAAGTLHDDDGHRRAIVWWQNQNSWAGEELGTLDKNDNWDWEASSGNSKASAISADGTLILGYSSAGENDKDFLTIWKVNYLDVTPNDPQQRIPDFTATPAALPISENNSGINALLTTASGTVIAAGYDTPGRVFSGAIWHNRNAKSYEKIIIQDEAISSNYHMAITALALSGGTLFAGGYASNDITISPEPVIWRNQHAPVFLDHDDIVDYYTYYGGMVTALSSNGEIAAGYVEDAMNTSPVIWHGENWSSHVVLHNKLRSGNAMVNALSGDGSVAAGMTERKASVWSGNHWEDWCNLPALQDAPGESSMIHALNASGTLAAGYANNQQQTAQPVLWQRIEDNWQIQPLPLLSGQTQGKVYALTRDGEIAAGGSPATIWWHQGGDWQALQVSRNPSEIKALSDDGSLAAGSENNHAVIWKIHYPNIKATFFRASRALLEGKEIHAMLATADGSIRLGGSEANVFSTIKAQTWLATSTSNTFNNGQSLAHLSQLTYTSRINALAQDGNTLVAAGNAETDAVTQQLARTRSELPSESRLEHPQHAVIWRDGAISDITPASENSALYALASSGELAGGVTDGNAFITRYHNDVWSAPCLLPGDNASVLALSASGEVAGGIASNSNIQQAAIWRISDSPERQLVVPKSPTFLPVLSGKNRSAVLALSGDGSLAGGYAENNERVRQPVLWQHHDTDGWADPTALTTLSGDLSGEVRALSSGTNINGVSVAGGVSGRQPVLWWQGVNHAWQPFALGTLTSDGNGNGEVVAISNNGEIIAGMAETPAGRAATIWKITYAKNPPPPQDPDVPESEPTPVPGGDIKPIPIPVVPGGDIEPIPMPVAPGGDIRPIPMPIVPDGDTPSLQPEVIGRIDVVSSQLSLAILASDTFNIMELQRQNLKNLQQGCIATHASACWSVSTGYSRNGGSRDNFAGFNLGHALSEHISGGISLSHSFARRLPDSYTSNGSNLSAGIYAEWRIPLNNGSIYLHPALAMGDYRVTSRRRQLSGSEAAKGYNQMRSFGATLEAGQTINFTRSASLQTGWHTGIRYSSVTRQGYREENSVFPVHYQDISYNGTSLYAGIDLQLAITQNLKLKPGLEIEQAIHEQAPLYRADADFGAISQREHLIHTRSALTTGLTWQAKKSLSFDLTSTATRTLQGKTAWRATFSATGTF